MCQGESLKDSGAAPAGSPDVGGLKAPEQVLSTQCSCWTVLLGSVLCLRFPTALWWLSPRPSLPPQSLQGSLAVTATGDPHWILLPLRWAELKEVHASCMVMPALAMYQRFYVTVILNFFSLESYLWEWRNSDLFESTAFSNRLFWVAGKKISKNVKWAQFEAVLPTCGEHCPWDPLIWSVATGKLEVVLSVEVKNINSSVIPAQQLHCLKDWEAERLKGLEAWPPAF